MEEKTNGGNGLAIASFVLALSGGILCITLLGLPIGILCLILALIFGIVALCKKQTKWASILGILFSLVGMIIPILLGRFIIQHKDQLIDPITDFSTRIEENPSIVAMLDDEEFSDKFGKVLEQRLQEKYGEEYSDINNTDRFINIWGDLFEEMKNVATELAEQEGLNALVPVESEETPAEATICDEFYKSGEEIVCTEQYEPVCGDNGQTYGNSCFACIEVDSYTNGECDAAEVEPVEVEPVVEE